MWKVAPPSSDIRDVFNLCVSGIEDNELNTKLNGQTSMILQKTADFVAGMAAGQAHGLQRTDFLLPPVTTDEMTDLYKSHFAKKDSAGRPEYDLIRNSTRWCCACGHQRVKTLDHYLPKSKYPALAVTPANLTPMCTACNQAKSSAVATGPETTFFHPYFDDFDSVVWLAGTVVSAPEPHVAFHIANGMWDPVSLKRIQYHLDKFNLDEMYRVQTGRLVTESQRSLERIWGSLGPQGVHEHSLEVEGDIRANRLNSWKGAAWGAFARSDWFCDRGYLQFVDF